MTPSCPALPRASRAGSCSITYRGRMDPLAPDEAVRDLSALRREIAAGGAARYHESNSSKGKMFARKRIDHLIDEGSFVEDGQLANALAAGLPADGVVTGTAHIAGRPVALMANDSTVKAGSWGARTVEKIIRI